MLDDTNMSGSLIKTLTPIGRAINILSYPVLPDPAVGYFVC